MRWRKHSLLMYHFSPHQFRHVPASVFFPHHSLPFGVFATTSLCISVTPLTTHKGIKVKQCLILHTYIIDVQTHTLTPSELSSITCEWCSGYPTSTTTRKIAIFINKTMVSTENYSMIMISKGIILTTKLISKLFCL